jgi:hypothetical protein
VADKFDPYREALVIEQKTSWPDDIPRPDSSRRAEIEAALHADPAQCGNLQYVRVMAGFCRHITVTNDDLQRLAS